MKLSALDKRVLRTAADLILEGKRTARFTWPALARASAEHLPVIGGESRAESTWLLFQFRDVFHSPVGWPDGDQETRCLAFLLMIEFYSDED